MTAPRVLIVAPCYYPAQRYGGPIQSLHLVCKELVSRGVDLTVYTTNANGGQDLQVPVGEEVRVDGVPVHYFQVKAPRSYFRSTQLKAALEDRLSEFSVVHINWIYVYTTLVAARLCRQRKVPYIITPRGMLDPFAIEMKGTLKKKAYLELFERTALEGARMVHFTSRGERDQAAVHGWKIRSHVVPNGVQVAASAPAGLAEFYENFPQLRGKSVVLVLGRINYIKGFDLLADAWRMVIEQFNGAHLVIVGPDDGYEATARALFAGCEPSVTFTGMLAGTLKAQVLEAATVLVCSSYLESFGMAIVEAMAIGKPVVVTDRVNIASEIAQAGAGMVTKCAAPDLARGLLALLSDEALRANMGARGRGLVAESYCLPSVASQTDEMYREAALQVPL